MEKKLRYSSPEIKLIFMETSIPLAGSEGENKESGVSATDWQNDGTGDITE